MKHLVHQWEGSVAHGIAPVRYCRLFDIDRLGGRANPFLLMDYFGPGIIAPRIGRRGFPEHPHRGFETVTLVFEGEVAHRDTTGAAGVIGPGDVQWMTAGRGVLHEEFLSPDMAADGGPYQMVQLWINLPAKDKMVEPRYQPLIAADIPVVTVSEGITVRVIAGTFNGTAGPARTHTPINLWDIDLSAGHDLLLPVPEGHVALMAVLGGAVEPDGCDVLLETHGAMWSQAGKGIHVKAREKSKLLLMSAEPIDEPIVASGPFVMNSQQEIDQASRDYFSGRFGAMAQSS